MTDGRNQQSDRVKRVSEGGEPLPVEAPELPIAPSEQEAPQRAVVLAKVVTNGSLPLLRCEVPRPERDELVEAAWQIDVEQSVDRRW